MQTGAETRKYSPPVAHGDVPDDEIARGLNQLADELEARVVSTASVDRDKSYGHGVQLRPRQLGAQRVGWVDFGDELAVFIGRYAWWELEARQLDDVDFIRLVCDAVIVGSGYEVTAPGRSLVALQLADGQPGRFITGEGCLLQFVPLPGWKRWGQRTAYQPYE